MANPPFFCDTSDAVGSTTCRSLKRPPPKTISSAARHESQTVGGEVYFCMRLIRDSIRYSTRVGYVYFQCENSLVYHVIRCSEIYIRFCHTIQRYHELVFILITKEIKMFHYLSSIV